MHKHLQQSFDINFLKIGQMVNAGVLQIGYGASRSPQVAPAGYTTVGTSLVSLPSPTEFAVPLQAPVREK